MKKLIVSIKSNKDVFSDFKKALTKARKGKLSGEHMELSFNEKKAFDRFVKNIGVLSAILNYKPKSVYELAKIVDMDVSNLNKLIQFFENIGVIKVRESKSAGRSVRMPIVEFDQIQFDLKSA